jgi:hypothetical protein
VAVAGNSPLRLISAQPAISPAASRAATASRFLFSMPAAPLNGGAAELRLEIKVEGQLFVEDVLRLQRDPSGATFEFLAGDAALQRLLTELAGTPRQAEVRIMLDDRIVSTFSLQEFVAYSQTIERQPFALSYPTSEVRTFGPAASVKNGGKIRAPAPNIYTCPDNCETDRQYCYQNTAECRYVDYCDVCESQYRWCLNYCQTNSDSDGDGVPDSSDNCPYAPNGDQADCDGDRAGDACDAFNGYTLDLGGYEYLDAYWGPFYVYCDGPIVIFAIFLGHFTGHHFYADVYCNGAVVNREVDYSYYGFFAVGPYYDPFACGYYGLTPAPSSTHETTPQAAAELQKEFWNDHKLSWSNGRLSVTGSDGEHALTLRSSQGEWQVEQRGTDLFLIGPSGAAPLSLDPVQVRAEDLTKIGQPAIRNR